MLRLASEAMNKYGIVETRGLRRVFRPDLERPSFEIETMAYMLAKRVENMPRSQKLSPSTEKFSRSLLGISLVTGSIFYGGIHLLVWNHSFRTATEQLLWRISGITIAVFGILVVLGVDAVRFLIHTVRDSMSKHGTQLIAIIVDKVTWLFLLVVFLASIFYMFCRIFILVECFLDIFHLPDSAFLVPRWSQYFPHIS